MRLATDALKLLLKGRPDTKVENPKYLGEMVECLAWLSPEELAWLVDPRTGLQTTLKYLPTPADVHTFIRETRARKEQFVPPPTAWRKIEDDPDAPWNRETDVERKKRVVREALGYDPDKGGAPAKRNLTPATAEDIGNLRLKTPAAPPTPQLIAKLEADGYPFHPQADRRSVSPQNVSELLRDLASRVERNVPHHRDPEQFHIEKSEIASELRRLAKRDAPRHPKPTAIST